MAAAQRDPLVDGAADMFGLQPIEGIPDRQSPTSDFDPLVDGAADMFGLERTPEAGASRGPDPYYDESGEQAAFPQPAGETQISEDLAPTGRQPTYGQQALMGLINDNPDLQVKFLEKKGFETRINPSTGEAEYKQSKGRWVPAQEGFVQYWPELVEGVLGAAATGTRALGAIGAPATGGASVAAATGLGAGVGMGLETIKQSLAKFLDLREDYDPMQIGAKGAEMGAGVAIGEGITRGAAKAGRGLKKAMLTESKVPPMWDTPDEIRAAAKKLNVEPTSGMLTSDPTVRGIEATQDKMGLTIAGAKDRAKIQNIRTAIQEAAEGLFERTTPRSAAESGQYAKEKIMSDIKKKLEPAEKIYKEIQGKLGVVKVNKKEQEKAIQSLRDNIDIKSPAVRAAFKDFEQRLAKVDTVDRLKALRSSLAEGMPQDPSRELKTFHNKAYDILTKMRTDSFVQGARDAKGKFLPSEYSQVINRIKEADKIWADTATEVQEALLPRGKKAKFGPKGQAERALNIAPEKMDKFYPGQDIEKVRAMRKLSPEATKELARQEISKIAKAVTSKGEGMQGKKRFNRVIVELEKKSPEVLSTLFNKHEREKVEAAKVLFRNAPFNPNPSESALEFGRQRAFTEAWIKNINSLGLSALKNVIQSDNPLLTKAGQQFIRDGIKAGIISTSSAAGLSKTIRDSVEKTETGKVLKEGRQRALEKRRKR